AARPQAAAHRTRAAGSPTDGDRTAAQRPAAGSRAPASALPRPAARVPARARPARCRAPPAAAAARPPRPAARAGPAAARPARPAAGVPRAAMARRSAAAAADAGAPAASATRRTPWAAAAGAGPGAAAAAAPARPTRPVPTEAATPGSFAGAPLARAEQGLQRPQQRLAEHVHRVADAGPVEACVQFALGLAEPGQEPGTQRARVTGQRLAGLRIDETAPVVEREIALGHGQQLDRQHFPARRGQAR